MSLNKLKSKPIHVGDVYVGAEQDEDVIFVVLQLVNEQYSEIVALILDGSDGTSDEGYQTWSVYESDVLLIRGMS